MNIVAASMMLLSACATPTGVSDGCAWTHQIDAIATNDDIFLVFVQNATTLRPLADQINAHNKARHEKCH